MNHGPNKVEARRNKKMTHSSIAQALLQYGKRSLAYAGRFTYPSLLKICASNSHLRYGQIIHASVLIKGLLSDTFIASSLVSMYAKCGSFPCVSQVFEALLHTWDITVWNSCLDAYFSLSRFKEGVLLFRRMQVEGWTPDAYTLCVMVNQNLRYPETQQIHACSVKNYFDDNAYLRTSLISAYFTHGKPLKSLHIFHSGTVRDGIVTWNAMIRGLNDNGLWHMSLKLYVCLRAESLVPVTPTFASTLTACSQGRDALFGEQVHCEILKLGFENDKFITTSLLTMYAKCKSTQEAEAIFFSVARKSTELWNSLLSAYTGNGSAYDALKAYKCMRSNEMIPDSVAFSNVLTCCSIVCSYDLGRSVHAELIKGGMQNNVVVQSSLVTMYSTFSNPEDAFLVFRDMNIRDSVAWGSMISGLCRNRKYQEAFELFAEMSASGVVIDSDVLATLSTSCSGKEGLSLGSAIHGLVLKTGWEQEIIVSTSLIDMYSTCCSPEMAGRVFLFLKSKNLVTWNSMISCYSTNHLPNMSISVFLDLIGQGLSPNLFTFTSVLVAISSTGMILYGKTVHAVLIRSEIALDIDVQNALIDMYAKCGVLENAESVLKHMHQKTLVTMNIMIAGYGSHGKGKKAMTLFDEMRRCEISPDAITFLSLLSCCNHSGMTEKGLGLLESMQLEYGIEPAREHYAIVVDLLSRAGRVDDALKVTQRMSMKADASIWLSLLWSSRAYGWLDVGKVAAEEMRKMESSWSGNYMQSVGYYREAKRWDCSASILTLMREQKVKKPPGCSWIQVGNRLHTFVSGHSSAPRIRDIYETLNCLIAAMAEKPQTQL